jgi:hypothetical protein
MRAARERVRRGVLLERSIGSRSDRRQNTNFVCAWIDCKPRFVTFARYGHQIRLLPIAKTNILTHLSYLQRLEYVYIMLRTRTDRCSKCQGFSLNWPRRAPPMQLPVKRFRITRLRTRVFAIASPDNDASSRTTGIKADVRQKIEIARVYRRFQLHDQLSSSHATVNSGYKLSQPSTRHVTSVVVYCIRKLSLAQHVQRPTACI